MAGISDKIKGKLKKAEGRITGDKVRETQGTVEEKKGDLEMRFNRAKNRVRARVDEARVKHQAKKATRK